MQQNIVKTRGVKNPIRLETRIVYGMTGGLIASAFLAVLLLIKSATEFQPDYDVLSLQGLAFQQKRIITVWATHFILGTIIWGTLFALVANYLGRSVIGKGALFGIITWLISMVVIMPMADAGLFASDYGQNMVIISLVLNLVFGLIQSEVYYQLLKYSNPQYSNPTKEY